LFECSQFALLVQARNFRRNFTMLGFLDAPAPLAGYQVKKQNDSKDSEQNP
jgi:hypothetical protein